MLKRVAGVFHVRPIIPDRALSLRKGRRGHELIQNDGEAMRVVAGTARSMGVEVER